MERADRNVRCDFCGCAFIPGPKTLRDGEIEYTFFNCPYCGKAHMIAVTDEGLRKNIAEYAGLAERNRKSRLPEEEQFRMQALKEANVNRAVVLRNRYLKDLESGSSPGSFFMAER
ncbi:MAG: hypothetical protein IIZ39_04310 [Blautia sp.]|nr:hypothetical protein [Blautia sp.]